MQSGHKLEGMTCLSSVNTCRQHTMHMLKHPVLLEVSTCRSLRSKDQCNCSLGLMPSLHSGPLRNGAARRYACGVCD
jgi:hypothetical protein